MPKVLIIEPSGLLWGSERALLDYLQIMSADSIWNLTVCSPSGPFLSAIKRLPNVSVETISSANLHRKTIIHRLIAAFQLAACIRRVRPDVICLNQGGMGKIVLKAAGLFSIPVIIHIRTYEDVGYLAKVLSGKNSSIVKYLICISKDMYKAAVEHIRFPAERIVTLYDAYEFQNPDVLESNSKRIPAVVCASRISRSKGQELLLRAVAELKAGVPEAKAVIIGSAPDFNYLQELKSLALRLNIDDRVEWAGFQQDVLAKLNKYSGLICPSDREALGRVIFEAWDAGLVPIAFKGSGGAAEIIEASGGGILYEAQDGKSLAKAIKRLLLFSEDERREMASRGKVWTKAACDGAQYVKNLYGIWESALRQT